MDPVVPNLYASPPIDLGFGRVPLQARAFLLQRPWGNLLLYGAEAIGPDQEPTVRALGGIARQYLNHAHEATVANGRIAETFGAPLTVHEGDAAEVARIARPGETFSDRHLVDGDFEVIPTPGHTAGATSYLWDTGQYRVLFTGDTIFLRDGEWVAALLDGISDRVAYVSSLQLLRELDFDLLVPGVAPVGQPYHAFVERVEAEGRIGEICERLWSGGDQ